jgi:hypothetical protein
MNFSSFENCQKCEIDGWAPDSSLGIVVFRHWVNNYYSFILESDHLQLVA